MDLAANEGARPPIAVFEGAALAYGRTTVIERLDLRIDRGDFWGIIGPNGSGKTTILRSLFGLVAPARGRIAVTPGVRFGYVVQRQALDPAYPLSVRDIAAMGRRRGFPPSGADRRVVDETLSLVGMREHGDTLFRDLSGGQKQRALIARALAAEPDVLVLDEPTNDLDVASESRIMDVIHDVHHEKGITVIIVSHLLHVIINHVERFVFLKQGAAVTRSIDEVVESDFLSRLYGVPIAVRTDRGKRIIVMG